METAFAVSMEPKILFTRVVSAPTGNSLSPAGKKVSSVFGTKRAKRWRNSNRPSRQDNVRSVGSVGSVRSIEVAVKLCGFAILALDGIGTDVAIFADILETHGNSFRNTRLLHRDAVKSGGCRHRFFRVSDDDEFGPSQEASQHIDKPSDV